MTEFTNHGLTRDVVKRDRSALALPVKLYLLTVIAPIGFSAGGLFLSPLRVLIMILAIPLFVKFVSGSFGRRSYIDYAICAYFLWTLISLAVVTPDRLVEVAGSRGIEMLGGYFMARIYIRGREDFVALLKWLAVIGIAMLPLAIVESVFRQVVILDLLDRLPSIRVEAIAYDEDRMGLRRSQVVFPHPILYGLFCSICFIMTLVGLKGSLPNSQRLFLATGIGVAGFLSLSSGAILAMILQISLVTWALVFNRFRRRWYALIGVMLFGLLIVAIISGDPPVRVFMRYATFSPHNAFWRATIFEYGMINVMQHPIFGMAENAENWVRPYWMPSPSIDNMWLVIAVQHGIPGFVLFVTPYSLALFGIARRDFSSDPLLNTLRYAWMFCFIGLAFSLATVAVWKTVVSFIFFMMGSGIWMISAKPLDGDISQGKQTDADQVHPISRYTRFPSSSDPQPQRLARFQ